MLFLPAACTSGSYIYLSVSDITDDGWSQAFRSVNFLQFHLFSPEVFDGVELSVAGYTESADLASPLLELKIWVLVLELVLERDAACIKHKARGTGGQKNEHTVREPRGTGEKERVRTRKK